MTDLALFGLPLTRYGLCAAVSVLVFWLVSWLWLRSKRVSYPRFCAYALCTLVLGWFMSRLVFALCSIPTYLNEYDGYFAPALYFWDGGYAITGMILGVVLGATLSARITGVPAGTFLNAAGLGLPAGIAMLRLGEFLADTEWSGDIGEGDYLAGGLLDDLLSRLNLLMQADGDHCYPVCLLECAFALLILIGLAVWLASRRWEEIPGDVLMVSLLLWGITQVIAEPLRDDGHLTFHFVPFQQVIALVMVVAVLSILLNRHRRLSKSRLPLVITIIASACIIVGVIACFMIDRYENKIVAWSLLIGPMIILGICALVTRRSANYIAGE